MGVFSLAGYRDARGGVRALRALLRDPYWLIDIKIELAEQEGIRIVVRADRDGPIVRASVPAKVNDIPVLIRFL